MQIKDIVHVLESFAAPVYQESYDNCGLLTGNPEWQCTGVFCTLDTLEATVEEAKHKGCNLIVSHHPVIFSGLKKLNGNNYVERTVIAALKNDIAIYAIHTNLDNVVKGVSKKMADVLGLENTKVLSEKYGALRQFSTYAPVKFAEEVKKVLFENGAGNIGNYTECSFSHDGTGSFKPNEQADPRIGEAGGRREAVPETKIECLLPEHVNIQKLLEDLKNIGYYEEVAHNITPLLNRSQDTGAGMVGELPQEMSEEDFLAYVKQKFNLQVIRHTKLRGRPVKTVALCGGSGAFLISQAKKLQADFYITADVKYHEFFDADNKIVIADIGHYESEQYTIELLFDILRSNFSTFAVLKTEICTNSIHYYS